VKLLTTGRTFVLEPGVAAVGLGRDPDVTRSAGRRGQEVLAAAAALGRRFDWGPLAAMVELQEEAVVVALNLRLDTVVGHVLHLPHPRV
jgi:hypothetical protein